MSCNKSLAENSNFCNGVNQLKTISIMMVSLKPNYNAFCIKYTL